MAGRFPLYTDADVDGPVVKALKVAGWDVLRAIDAYPERTADLVHFERAVQENRVLVSNDQDMLVLAQKWIAEAKTFPGLIRWRRSHQRRMSPGDFCDAFEELAAEDNPFAVYPIVHLKPRS